jgi:exonuclease VII small subunit
MCAAGCGKGDLVGYRHRLNGGDGKPKGKDFTDIVKGLASEAGVDMPRIENKKIENRELSFEEAMKRTEEIIEELGDPALQMWELEKLASKCSKGITAAKLRQMHQIRVDNFREFNPKDVHEILATAPETREWLIADLISKATTIVLNADGGVGKTLLIYDLVKAIATGRRWNGFNTQKGKVLIIQTDEPEIDTAERLNIAHFGEEVETGYVKFETNWQFSQIKQLTKWVKQEVPSLVVIDSLTSCNRDTTYEEKDIAYARCLYELRDLANELGITFIVLHHTNKQGGARGTTGIRNNVSEVWNLRKGETKENLLPLQRVLQFDKSRSGCAGSIVLELNPDDYSWKYLNKVNEPQGGMAPYPARLLGFFNKNQGTKYDPEELVEIIPGATKDACRKTCERLWKRGHIKREERIKSFNGRNYRSFVYYTPNEYINSQNKGEQKEVLSSLELQQRNTNSFEAGQASGQEPDNLDKDELETLQQRNTNSFEAGQAKKEDVQIQNKTGNASLDLTSSAMSSSETVDIQGLQQNHQGNTDSVQMLSSSLSSSETVDIQEVEGASGQNVEKEDKRRFKCGGLSSISIGDDVTYIGEKLAQQFKEIRLVVLSVDEDRETARLKKTNGYETGDIPLKDLRLRMGF